MHYGPSQQLDMYRGAVISYWHEILVNRLRGLSLPRKSMVRLTDRPDMTLDIYRGRKTTTQQQQQQLYMHHLIKSLVLYIYGLW